MGIKLVKRWWRSCYGAWVAVTLPVFMLLLLLPKTLYAVIAFWWLKPLFERAHLFILSQAILGNAPGIKETVKSIGGLLRPQWFSSLTYRRLALTRSMDLPVIQLEKLSGKSRSKRIQVLHKENSRAAFWLTVVGAHIETALLFGLLFLVYLFIPQDPELSSLDFISQFESRHQYFYAVFIYLSIGLVSPFYVAGGFCVYLNRRIHLECWDIELAFRKIARRLDKKPRAVSARAMLLIVLFGLMSGPPPTLLAQAAKPNPTAHDIDSAKILIGDILDSAPYNQKITSRRLKGMDPEESDNDLDGWSEFGKVLSTVFEVLLWSGLAAIIVYLLLQLSNYSRKPASPRTFRKRKPPISLFGLDLRKEQLPADINQELRRLWREGDHRQAVSLLYRSALVHLAHQQSIPIHDSDTEMDCLDRSREYLHRSVYSNFLNITNTWVATAYAHRPPAERDFFDMLIAWHSTLDAQKIAAADVDDQ